MLEFIACNEICNNKSCRLGTQITISCNLVEKHCGRHMKFYKEMQLIHVPILCVLKCTCKPRFTKIEIKCIKIRRQPIQKLQITTKPQDEAKKFNESPPLVAVTVLIKKSFQFFLSEEKSNDNYPSVITALF